MELSGKSSANPLQQNTGREQTQGTQIIRFPLVAQEQGMAAATQYECGVCGKENLKPPKYLTMKKESVSMPTAKLTGEKRIPDVDMDIREISYTIMKDEEEMTYFKRFIFRDNCMYQLTIGGKTEDLEELESQRDKFFNSVKFDQNTRK